MDSAFLQDPYLNAPVEPGPDWLTDEDVDRMEAELGLVKTASDIKERRAKEEEMLKAFKSNPSQQTFMPLYTSYKPLIYSAAKKNMHRSTIPEAAHMAWAAQSFLDAVRTYDPKKGAQFRTHATNTVFEKGKRLNLTYQNIGYIPEARATKYQVYKTAVHLLQDELGREPTSIEIADETGLPVTEIERLRKEVTRDYLAKEHIVSRGMSFAQSDKAMQVAYDVHYTLDPKHQLVLEYTLGLYGRPSMVKPSGKSDIRAIAKATGLQLSDVRSARKTINREFKKHRSFMGKQGAIDGLFDESAEE